MSSPDGGSTPPPEAPQVSPDGKFYLDGETWKPFPGVDSAAAHDYADNAEKLKHLNWNNSPGLMVANDKVDWQQPIGLWGPTNPLRPPKTWGPIHVFYSFLILVVVAFVPSLFAIGYVIANADLAATNDDINDSISALATNPVFLIVSLLSLWVVFGGYPLWITYRRGARSFKKDFGLSFRWKFDIVFGIFLAGALRLAESVLTIGASALGLDLTSADNSSFLNDPNRAIAFTILLAVATGIGAPFFEELFFRGFTVRAILRGKKYEGKRLGKVRVSAILAVVISSVYFGTLHITALNSGGFFLIGVTGLLGATFAIVAIKIGRIGPTITAHAVFNTSAVIAVLIPALAVWLLPAMGVLCIAAGIILAVWRKNGSLPSLSN